MKNDKTVQSITGTVGVWAQTHMIHRALLQCQGLLGSKACWDPHSTSQRQASEGQYDADHRRRIARTMQNRAHLGAEAGIHDGEFGSGPVGAQQHGLPALGAPPDARGLLWAICRSNPLHYCRGLCMFYACRATVCIVSEE